MNLSQLLNPVVSLAAEAGRAILEVYASDFDVQAKDDQSPLTQADLASHHIIVAGLARLTPELPIISEESGLPDFTERSQWNPYWLIDPLDGTKEFVKRNGEFTVNIALIDGHRAMFGVVGVPVQGTVYTGDLETATALRHDASGTTVLHGRTRLESDPLVVVASRSHGGERLENYLAYLEQSFGEVERTPVGSSLKLCILAEGRADLYPRLGPTSEWDIAAAHAVLEAAGGTVWTVSGEPLAYNRKESFLNPEFFAAADSTYPWRSVLPAVDARQ